jgi:hypothetical protein
MVFQGWKRRLPTEGNPTEARRLTLEAAGSDGRSRRRVPRSARHRIAAGAMAIVGIAAAAAVAAMSTVAAVAAAVASMAAAIATAAATIAAAVTAAATSAAAVPGQGRACTASQQGDPHNRQEYGHSQQHDTVHTTPPLHEHGNETTNDASLWCPSAVRSGRSHAGGATKTPRSHRHVLGGECWRCRSMLNAPCMSETTAAHQALSITISANSST